MARDEGRARRPTRARGGRDQKRTGAARPAGATGYAAELGAVLRRRDPEALRAFLAASARRYGNAGEAAAIEAMPREEMLLTLHRMIMARPDLRDLQAESARWLRTHGLDPELTRATDGA
ncbi:MAG: hypothetical protein IRZ14_03765 [Chloroflexi bacterium]|jgi:hypothetical protein|nr:hypothetical protein [Chloroflexota bacterium]